MVFGPVKQRSNVPLTNLMAPRLTFAERLIEEQELTGSAAQITFNNIPGTYRHLILWLEARVSGANEGELVDVWLNNDVAANYRYATWYFRATAVSGVASSSLAAGFMRIAVAEGANSTANSFAPNILKFLAYNYSDRTRYVLNVPAGKFGDTSALGDIDFIYAQGRWHNAANDITRIDIAPSASANLVAGTRACLYGVL